MGSILNTLKYLREFFTLYNEYRDLKKFEDSSDIVKNM